MAEASDQQQGAGPVLELVDLHKRFRLGIGLKRVHAVRGVSLEVRPGEIFGYLGPNGAGKTTTMKMMMGLIRASEGQVRLFGRPVEERSVRQRIGYLPEHPHFYDYLTAPEALDFYGRLFGIPKKKRRDRVDELVTLVGLDHAGQRRLRRFSKGMLQRLGIAQALINDPDMVVLDEPLSGIDPVGRREIRDLIADLKTQGKTVFFSSHILHDIEMICDRVAIIHQGRIQRLGALEELLRGGRNLVHVVAGGVPAEAEAELRQRCETLSRVGAVVTLNVQEDELSEVLRQLLDLGARVSHVSPQRDSLEEMFVREAGGGA